MEEESNTDPEIVNQSLKEIYDEDEIFIGPVTTPERSRIHRLGCRKTEIFYKPPLIQASNPNKDTLENEGLNIPLATTNVDGTFSLETYFEPKPYESDLNKNNLELKDFSGLKNLSAYLNDLQTNDSRESDVEDNVSSEILKIYKVTDKIVSIEKTLSSEAEANINESTDKVCEFEKLKQLEAMMDYKCEILQGMNFPKFLVENEILIHTTSKKLLDQNSGDKKNISLLKAEYCDIDNSKALGLNRDNDLETESEKVRVEYQDSGLNLCTHESSQEIVNNSLDASCSEDLEQRENYSAETLMDLSIHNFGTNEKSDHLPLFTPERKRSLSSVEPSCHRLEGVSDTKNKPRLTDVFCDQSLKKNSCYCVDDWKRKGYFSSLELVNVDDTHLYDSFCVEEPKYNITKPQKTEDETSNIDIQKKASSISSGKPERPVSNTHENDSKFRLSSISESLPSFVSESESRQENLNYGMIMSHPSNSTNDSKKKLDDPAAETSNHYEEDGGRWVNLNESSGSSLNFNSGSPQKRFNDTIEEMEMLLKYGVDYFEKVSVTSEPSEKEKLSSNSSNCCDDEESIISPKKMHVESVSSLQSFNPNFDSTHASSENAHDRVVENIPECSVTIVDQEGEITKVTIESCSPHIESKKVAPPKPPRCISPITKEEVPSKTVDEISALPSKDDASSSMSDNFYAENITSSAQSEKINADPHPNKCLKICTSTDIPPLATPKSTNFHSSNKYFRTPNRTICNHPLRHKSSPVTPNSVKTNQLAPHKQSRIFLTPQIQAPSRIPARVHHTPTFKASGSMYQKVRGLNIVSPVAKYLQENPPPPLIATIKPRFKLSPHRVGRDALSPTKKDLHLPHSGVQLAMNDSVIEREATKKKIQENVEILTSKMKRKSPLKDINSSTEIPVHSTTPLPSVKSVLPPSNYHQVAAIQLENKENTNSRREIPSDRPPASILRHKGRMKLPKQSFKHLEERVSPLEEPSSSLDSSRMSLIDVSVWEPHSVHHTNTLH